MLVTIAICTYRRADLLALTLTAVSEMKPVDFPWELLVVDNNSPDDTKAVSQTFISATPSAPCRYILETTQGLSHGRNRAVAEARGGYVCFIDDDAKPRPDFLVRLGFLIRETEHKIVGGLYLPWYHFGRPAWYRDKWASNELPLATLSVPGGNWMATGCVMLLEKQLIERLGGFNPEVGMNGSTIAYGEETYLQEAAARLGYRPAYDPLLVVDHAVLPYKLEPGWFFKSHFALGRDRIIGGEVTPTPFNLALELLIGCGLMLVDLLRFTPRLLSPNYYVQNWLIDIFRKPAKRVGTIYYGLLSRSSVGTPAD